MSYVHKKVVKNPTMAGQLNREFVRITDPEQVKCLYELFDKHKKALLGDKMAVMYVLPRGDEIVAIYGSNDFKEEVYAKVTRLYPSKLSRHKSSKELWKKFKNQVYISYLTNLKEHGEYKQGAFK